MITNLKLVISYEYKVRENGNYFKNKPVTSKLRNGKYFRNIINWFPKGTRMTTLLSIETQMELRYKNQC